MNKLLTFLKQWTLVVALCVGSLVYLLFSEIPVLEPIGDFMGPKLVALLPYVIFLILYVTFCKIQVKELRPRTWHFILQGIRVALSAICVALVAIAPSPGWKLIFEGMFICFICPTAAAWRQHRVDDRVYPHRQLRHLCHHPSFLPNGGKECRHQFSLCLSHGTQAGAHRAHRTTVPGPAHTPLLAACGQMDS